MNYRLFPASERGFADYGWLKTHYSFSFANWYHPEKIHFGMLRVLNDDNIAPHSGFDFHPHNDMEIITILLEGELTHQDSMGNKGVIKKNEVQVMSAGTGIFHSEKNESNEWTKLFQIWIFPDKKGHTPRYEQKPFPNQQSFQLLVSPDGRDNSLWIHQNAFITRLHLSSEEYFDYHLHHPSNGVYVMNINGEFSILQHALQFRDAIGVWNTPVFNIHSSKTSDILLIEVPMH
ncbi:MAG: pirin family protein [Bacteroidia bacterium]